MICLSLYGTTEEICDAIAASTGADLFEIRLDLSTDADPARIRTATSKPLIFTAHGQPDALKKAAPYANYLDVETEAAEGRKYIVSYHGGEEDAAALWQKYSGDHITKIVLNTSNYETIYSLMRLNRDHHPDALCFAMGEVGAFSRILSVFAGAPWVYACLPGKQTAPGQFRLQELLQTYRLKRFREQPVAFGIIGKPVSHSRSPEFHNRKFAEENLPWIYLPFHCEDLKSLFHHATQFGIRGFSITHPWKQDALKLVSNANELSSCNTAAYANGKWIGTDTDVEGVTATLQSHKVSISDKRVLILGAGGSAFTIASVVRPHARELIVLSRSVEKAQKLAAQFDARAGTFANFASYEYDVLFHATPAGLKPGESPIDLALLKPGKDVIDLIYNPPETALLHRARELGCNAVNGETWFLAQAEAQFAWWKQEIRL